MDEKTTSLSSIAPADLARLFTALGFPTSLEEIEKEIAHGAPTNPDGTLNLVDFGAWTVRELGRLRDRPPKS